MVVGPLTSIGGYFIGRDSIGGPGVVEEEGGRKFQGFYVTDVHDPYFVVLVLPGKVQLFPNPGKGVGVYPFIVAGSADIVEMIVQAIAACSRFFTEGGQFADVAPVVVAEQEGDIIGDAHALIIIILYLLVKGPGLRGGFGRLAGYFLDDGALIADDLFKQGDVATFGHRHIAVTAHAYRDDAFMVVHMHDAFFPKAVQYGGILCVVPGAGAIAFPFLLGAEQGLVMAGAHDDTILRGPARVEGIVGG